MAVLLVPLVQVLPASTAGAAPEAAPATPVDDTRELTRKSFSLDGEPVQTPSSYQPKAAKSRTAAAATPPVGTVRQWLGLDDLNGTLYRKDYTLRGVGEHIEVWVANDIAFPEGDCRRQIPNSTEVTDAQVADLVNEFDNNMYPKETATFSTPPDRDGTNAQLDGDYTGDGDNTVALIDNVRDDNYYDFPAAPTYIAGFFSGQFNELFDRNVMTIDAYDWAHRTGAAPPDEPTDDLCTSRPGRPRLYEGTFAHEWQHLLMYYTDPFEGNWINEGLSDFAQTLVGYVDTRLTVFDEGGDSHLYCFQGFGTVETPFNQNPRDCGGPENSLTLWGDGDSPNAVLADYGNAYSIMQFLYDRYGADFMSRLHQDGEHQGLASLDAALEAEGVSDMWQVLHDHQSMVLLDKVVGERRGIMLGTRKSRVTTPSLRSTVNLDNPQSYDDPGAAPNGADYVRLQRANGTQLRGHDLRSLRFEGAAQLPAQPLEWTTVSDDPDSPGDSVLWSGNGNNINATAVAEVAVPSADPTLRFDAKYGAELGYDYGYVVVSTDGGETYTAVAGDKTVAGPGGPSLNGTTDGFEPHAFDLSAYAGQTVLVGLRYVSDGGVNEGGILVDDVTVGGDVLSDGSSLEPFDSPTEINPVEVDNWNVKIVGFDERNRIGLQAEFDGRESLRLGTLQLIPFMLFKTVVVTVAYDEPTETVQQYAPYTLTANGVTQPGGA
ncbi:immune inhibitor A domain-containing protein [Actinophytocola gossypii]|uniref:Immune inhibitor A n=1 Tax=Actinophytocola gossypii TaxID=2812003 RepID=A0ABT2J172_9PSEU|nr:immune inhibitor A domain-containing protein [Actinophytocola gossypii]MCT2581610.1 immune inhibitor A [Actinophytocola gossypii]